MSDQQHVSNPSSSPQNISTSNHTDGRSLFLVSWNVAGWVTTVSAIRSSFGSLETYLKHLNADILCLQEVKVSKKKLEANEVLSGACDRPGFPIPGYESFWSHNNSDNSAMNGVTTFVRTGLTLKADAAPLRNVDMDKEGRCVVTYHSHLSVFNVYVPNSRGGTRQEYKADFLSHLRQAMDRVRQETGKPVILAGDLNLTYRAEDCHYSNRKLSLNALLHVALSSEHMQDTSSSSSPSSHETLVPTTENGEPIVFPHNCCTLFRYPFTEYEVQCMEQAATWIRDHLKNKASAPALEKAAVLLKSTMTTMTAVDTTAMEIGRRQRKLLLDEIIVLRHVLMTVDQNPDIKHVWVESLLKGSPNAVNDRHAAIYVASQCVGFPCHSIVDSEFAWSLIDQQKMIDTFAYSQDRIRRCEQQPSCTTSTTSKSACTSMSEDEVCSEQSVVHSKSCGNLQKDCAHNMCHVGAVGTPRSSDVYIPDIDHQPYTCWDQYRNKRYENEGNRIDYIIADSILAPHIIIRDTHSDTLQPAPPKSTNSTITATPTISSAPLMGFSGQVRTSSILRATASGRYTPAPTTGSGLEKLRDVDRMLQFEGLPRTGLVVTPPQYSDHIGVSLHLALQLEPIQQGSVVADGGAMFRRRSHNLKDMFARVAASTKKPAVAVSPSVSSIQPSSQVGTIGAAAPAKELHQPLGATTMYSEQEVIARKRSRPEDDEVIVIDE